MLDASSEGSSSSESSDEESDSDVESSSSYEEEEEGEEKKAEGEEITEKRNETLETLIRDGWADLEVLQRFRYIRFLILLILFRLFVST